SVATSTRSLLVAVLAVCGLVAAGAVAPQTASGFGTIASQGSEHERITRLALACPGGKGSSNGDCFEPRSLDQLAGHGGTFGAVGAPDSDEVFTPEAHCDKADFLAGTYPQSRAAATAALTDCVGHLKDR